MTHYNCWSRISTTTNTLAAWQSDESISGEIALGDQVSVAKPDGSFQKVRVSQLYAFEGLKRAPVQRAGFGEIVALAGVDNVEIGDTITSVDNPQPLPVIAVDEPTISMIFSVNNSPFAGKGRQVCYLASGKGTTRQRDSGQCRDTRGGN